MLSPSEFNNAVPKFTNGNYANNPVDPQYIEEPTLQDYNRGVEPLETLPAQWWNWLCNQFTSRFNKINTYVKNIFDEITQLLSLLNISPDGTESAITTGQLKNFFKELYPTYVSDKLELGTTYVPQTRTVNGHALTENVTVTKSDVGLGSVANTGDSANVSNGGTTKFTTGGAYNILTSIAPLFSSSTAYSVGALVTYQNKFYECTTAHSAGAWNSSHFTERSVAYIFTNYILPSFAPTFSTATAYSVGTFVIYQNRLYKCTTAHSAGAWNSSHFALATLNDLATAKADKVAGATNNDIAILDANGNLRDSGISVADLTGVTDLAPLFSTTASYAVGEYVIYNENMYRCTVAHTGAWNANDFTRVTVGGELTNKADISDLAVPTDAVLHYSFDDLPDYPDGTADVRLLDNNTYDIQSTAYSMINSGGTVFSSEGGNLKAVISSGQSWNGLRINYKSAKVVKIKIKVTELSGGLRIKNGFSTESIDLDYVREVGEYEYSVMFNMDVKDVDKGFGIIAINATSSATVVVEQIYIGDGSYSTPIIDNANGKWNSVSQSGVAVQGVSGKAIRFLGSNYIKGNLPWRPSIKKTFTVSCWVKNWDKVNSTYLDIMNDWDTTGISNVLLEFANVSSGKTIYFDVPSENGCYRLGANANVINWNNVDTNMLHIVGIFNGQNSVLYVNGKKISIAIDVEQTLSDTTRAKQFFQFGRVYGDSNASYDKADFDDYLIFDRALSEKEVVALYNNKANTPKYYDLDDYKFANGDTAPTANSNNFVQSKTLYDFFGGNTSAQSWLGKVFGWALGKNWTQATGYSTTETISCIYYANEIWVVGGSSQGMWWSTDGKSWTQVTGSIADKSILTLYYANGIWIAGTLGNGLWWSTDGKSWIQGTGDNTIYTVTCVRYANGIWVAGTQSQGFWWSTDGKSWTQGNNTTAVAYDVYFGDGIWVSACSGTLRWSTDGKNWTNGTVGKTVDPRVVYFADNVWKAASPAGILTSTDGKDWTVEKDKGNFTDIYYANGVWVAVSINTGAWIMKGTSGWIQTDLTFPSVSVYYANNIWVVSSANRGFWWSTNGETWIPSNVSDYIEGGITPTYRVKTVYYGDGTWIAGSLSRAGLWWSSYENAGLK